ncbi:MAG TPA: CAP domain-containing protein [Candidatus Paceibacterota bacterium]|nr:CAP domain-containing protein [Candidatus Paceibacterota bacterium]
MREKIPNNWWPQADNNYLPTLLQRGAMLGMTFLVLLSFLVTNFQALLWQTSEWLVGAILPAVVVTLTNNERQALAAPPLYRNPLLDQAASLKAEHMAALGYFAHNSPDGVTPWHWFKEVGYVYAHAGENLAVYFSDSDEVVKAWMNSPTHRANIVNSTYQEIGIGTAKGRYQGYDTVFVVQLFGTPAIAPLPPRVAAVTEVVSTGEQVPNLESSRETAIATASGTEAVLLTQGSSPNRVLGAETEPDSPTVTEVYFELATDPASSYLALAEEETVMPPSVEEPEVVPATTLPTESLFLSPVATSSGLLPVISRIENTQESVSLGARLATQPNKLLRYMYLFVGSLTVLALWASVLLAWRQRQLVDVSYGLALLLLMCGLFYVHQFLTNGAVIV